MKKRILTAAVSFIFVLLLTVPTIAALVFGESGSDVLVEKRELTPFPKNFSNTYMADVEYWYDDHVPFRISLITFQKQLSQKTAAFYRHSILPLLSEAFSPDWSSEENDYLAPAEDGLVIYGRGDWLFFLGDYSLDYYTGSNLLSEEELECRANVFLELQEKCSEKGIEFAVLIAPNKERLYSEFMPSYSIASQIRREDRLLDFMQSRNINYLFPLCQMQEAKSICTLYDLQDTHWNTVGAYIGYFELMESVGLPCVPVEELEIAQGTRQGGDLSYMCGYSTEYTDYSAVYRPEVSFTHEISDDGGIETFASSAGNGRKALLIGDSFRERIKDFFAKDFSETTVAYMGYRDDERVARAVNSLSEGDLLVILAVERYDNDALDDAVSLLNCLNN